MKIKFDKMHGNGNDFIVVNDIESDLKLTNEKISFLAHRNFGIGFDQLIFLTSPKKPENDFDVKFFNADGGQADLCLNGIRCLTEYIHRNKFSSKKELAIQTKNKNITCKLNGNNVEVLIDYPKYFSNANIEKKLKKIIKSKFNIINVGNIHLLIKMKSIKTFDLDRLYLSVRDIVKTIEANVSIYSVDKNGVKIRTFENGAGETLACGSASTAVASIFLNNKKQNLEVTSRGGSISFRCKKDKILMSGPSKYIYTGYIYV